MQEKMPIFLPEEMKRDWETYKDRYEAYNSLLDDMYKILEVAQDKEAAKKFIREKWLPKTREAKEEAAQLREEFIQKYGEDTKKELTSLEIEKIESKKGEAREEDLEKFTHRSEMELEFDLAPKFDPEKFRETIEKNKKEEKEDEPPIY